MKSFSVMISLSELQTSPPRLFPYSHIPALRLSPPLLFLFRSGLALTTYAAHKGPPDLCLAYIASFCWRSDGDEKRGQPISESSSSSALKNPFFIKSCNRYFLSAKTFARFVSYGRRCGFSSPKDSLLSRLRLMRSICQGVP